LLCAYLDECGNTGSNIHDPSQRYHYVGAVIVPEGSWEALRDDLAGIAAIALGKKVASSSGFEFHGNQLFSGNGPWGAIPDRNNRLIVYGQCLDLLAKHKLTFAYGRCDKQALKRYKNPMHPHEIGFWLTLERVGIVFKNRDSLGFIVADEGSKFIKQIARKGLEDYRVYGPPFGKKMDISKVIDTIHFMDSVESSHLQICDMALWIVQRFRALDQAARDALEHNRIHGVPTLEDLYDSVSSSSTGSATFPY
jgi:hypothetical protein